MPLGEHQIEVYLDGYRSYTQKVLFTPGTTIRIAHDMQPLAPGEVQPAKPAPDPATTRTPERYQRPEYQRPDYQRPEYQRPERPEQPAEPRGEQQAGFGTLAIRVNPPDAEVLIDGEAWERPAGESRLLIELAAGPHQVEIRKAGYRPYVRTIDVLGGRTFTLNVSLPQGGPSMLQINSRR